MQDFWLGKIPTTPDGNGKDKSQDNGKGKSQLTGKQNSHLRKTPV